MGLNFNTEKASKYLQSIGIPFTKKTLEVWRCQGRGPKFKKISNRVFYEKCDLDEFSKGTSFQTNHATMIDEKGS